jgi:SAM-dependent methyltransferase
LTKGGWPVNCCDQCDHLFVHPPPTEKQLADLYSFEGNYMVKDHVDHSKMRAVPTKFAGNLKLVQNHTPKGGRVLEVGCSDGAFLYLLGQTGFRAEGVELNPDTAAIAKANGLTIHVGTLMQQNLESASYDAVVLGDLLEHVEDAQGLLAQAWKLLKPEGQLYVVTPNHDAFFPKATWLLYRIFGIPWSHPPPPYHLHQFSVRSLTILLRESGFEPQLEEYAPCSLSYELIQTTVPGRLKRAFKEKRAFEIIKAAAMCALALIGYSAIWILDRMAIFKQKDFTMKSLSKKVGRPD